MRLVAHCLESRPRTEGADFGICQTFAASPAEPGELPCWFRDRSIGVRTVPAVPSGTGRSGQFPDPKPATYSGNERAGGLAHSLPPHLTEPNSRAIVGCIILDYAR